MSSRPDTPEPDTPKPGGPKPAAPLSAPAPIALEQRAGEGDGRRWSPSAARNRGPVRSALIGLVPPAPRVLEIASGTGEHAVTFAAALPDADWFPTEHDPESLISVAAWRAASGLENVRVPVRLDAAAPVWPVEDAAGPARGRPFDVVLAMNMVHIAPWAAVEGLFAGAGRVLSGRGQLMLYGPFQRAGVHTSASNADFDASLKARNPGWGVRDLDALDALAAAHGLAPAAAVSLPANNQLRSWRRSHPSGGAQPETTGPA